MQLEAMALKEAVQMVTDKGITDCIFMSDNRELVDLVSRNTPPTQADWREFSEILNIWKALCGKETMACVYISRSQNNATDTLAKLGRQQGWDLTGFTYPMVKRL